MEGMELGEDSDGSEWKGEGRAATCLYMSEFPPPWMWAEEEGWDWEVSKW